jgi:stage II sporulation protein D
MRKGPGEAIELSGTGGGRQSLRLARAGGPGEPSAVLLVLAGPLTITADEKGWIIVDGSGHRSVIDGSEALEVGSVRGGDPMIRVQGTVYPGVVQLVSRTSEVLEDAAPTMGMGLSPDSSIPPRGMDVVNVLPMELYLPGVVAKELYASWKLETFKAQVVAARSYACMEVAWWRGRRHYDVVAGQASQAYIGVTDNASANRAVRETRGQLLLFQNKVLPAYYSSACGGLAANAVDAISDHPINDIAPLRAGAPRSCCAWAPVFRWKSEQSSGEAAQRLLVWTAQRPRWRVNRMGPVRSIEVAAANQVGRPVRYRISDGEARIELPSEPLRMALNLSGDRVGSLRSPVRSGFFTAAVGGGTVMLAGHGFGHGVGMCQHGAEGMARSGSAWSEILDVYYPGATVGRSYP